MVGLLAMVVGGWVYSLCRDAGVIALLVLAFELRETEVISQRYAFGFFSIMHAGLALGGSRFRLFALDRLSYHVWLWIGVGLRIFAIDALILHWLRARHWVSLAAALFIGSFLYFPLRQILISRFTTPRSASIVGKVPQVVSVGLARFRNTPDEKAANDLCDDQRHALRPARDYKQCTEIF